MCYFVVIYASLFKTKVDGLIISNTTISRPLHLKNSNKKETGGLSGAPVKDLSTQCIADMFKLTGGNFFVCFTFVSSLLTASLYILLCLYEILLDSMSALLLRVYFSPSKSLFFAINLTCGALSDFQYLATNNLAFFNEVA